MPYQANDDVSCDSITEGWEETSVIIPGWGYITLEEANVINIKNALMHHSVSAHYDVYEDFSSYNGGIYEHTFGDYVAGHAILIVGWEDENQCWIVKNSWGSNWGENGYFRIRWGSCGMGKNIPFIYDELVDDIDITFSQENIAIELPAGSEVSETISITNNGNQTIDLYTTDSQNPNIFHRSGYQSYDGQSWWCGLKNIKGYGNHWLQYLETPNINLSSVTNPQLNFNAKWSMETSGGAQSPYDGWDGWNVWISTDNGESYSVIEPVFPIYTNSALWAFGEPEQGWNMGTSIAGWSGYSNQWEEVQFDFSEYSGENIKIRFALASDMGYSSSDDATLNGLFIDNIFIHDDGTEIFLDTAGTDSQMEQIGFGDLENTWMDIDYNSNRLASGESMDLILNCTAPNETGKYSGNINFMSNNNNQPLPELAITLQVTRPENDIAIENIFIPGSIFSSLIDQAIGTNIVNNGTTNCNNIEIEFVENSENKHEILILENILAGEVKTLWFSPEWLKNIIDPNITIKIKNSDDIMSNNSDSISYTNDYRLDNFETFNNYWILTDNCSYTLSDVYDGLYALKFLDGNSATYKKAIKINTSALTFEFYAKTQNLTNPSELIFEFSYDKINWTLCDSIQIISDSYEHYSFGLDVDISKEKIWFRIIDNQSRGNSIFIDDICVSNYVTAIDDDESVIINQFSLSQNYPNPFNPTTVIGYQIPQKTKVELNVYDLSGRLIENLVNKNQSSGNYKITWDATNYPSGIYFYKLNTDQNVDVQKMVLMK